MFMPSGKIDIRYCKKNFECIYFIDSKLKLFKTEFWEQLGDHLFTVNKKVKEEKEALEFMRVFTAGKAYAAKIPLSQLGKNAY